jgi:hypothetical protein
LSAKETRRPGASQPVRFPKMGIFLKKTDTSLAYSDLWPVVALLIV